jgi:hypothetical protein
MYVAVYLVDCHLKLGVIHLVLLSMRVQIEVKSFQIETQI